MSHFTSKATLLSVLVLGIFIGNLTAAVVVNAWTGPTATPPSGNVTPPINVGSGSQVKDGPLGVGGLAVFGNTILQASSYLNWGTTAGFDGYGIRDSAGTMQFKNVGGTWQSIQEIVSSMITGISPWVIGSAGSIYYNGGNVGIGIASPLVKLDVTGPVRMGNATLGAACSPEGAMAYDLTAHTPIFCNQKGVWAAHGSVGGAFSGSNYMDYTYSSARSLYGGTYTNTGTTPRFVMITAAASSGANGRLIARIYVNGMLISNGTVNDGNGQYGFIATPNTFSFIVPAGATYSVNIFSTFSNNTDSSGQKLAWVELQ